MNTNDILYVLDRTLCCTEAKTWDCVPADYLTPELFVKRKLPTCVIFNTAKSNDPSGGVHWLCIIVTKKNSYFFDSYGKPPEYYGFRLKCRQINNSLQGPSDYCGIYCILFCVHLMSGGSLRSFHAMFSRNRLNNDKKALLVFNKLTLCNCTRKKNNRCINQSCTKRM